MLTIIFFILSYYRPEYSWKIARWTLNTNHSINLFYYSRIKVLMWNNKYLYLCFLLLFCLAGSSRGFLKMSRNIGSNFLKMTVETEKFLSNRSIFSLKSLRRLAISDHFFILLKNCIKLKNKIFNSTSEPVTLQVQFCKISKKWKIKVYFRRQFCNANYTNRYPYYFKQIFLFYRNISQIFHF